MLGDTRKEAPTPDTTSAAYSENNPDDWYQVVVYRRKSIRVGSMQESFSYERKARTA